jgi:hypothetical protein
MATATAHLTNLSQASLSALRWAQAAAAHRKASASAAPAGSGHPPDPARQSSTQGVSVEPDDVLVGILLTRPDEHGEARVLLEHFGLTALDVLPKNYPKLPAADLRKRAASVDPHTNPQLGPGTMSVLDTARQLGHGHADLRHLLGALLQHSHPFRWSAAFASRGTEQTQVMESYQRWLASALPGPVAGSTSDIDNGGRIAGCSLAKWLDRENPRRPIDLPVYAPDQIDAECDLIGIDAEADAFAYLIASCDLKPPLAIGLFGDWGSGKSFLMRAIDQRLGSIGRLVKDQDQRTVRVWKNIVTIEFNAWEYVQGNLWAGLLERIFGELGNLKPTLVESWRRPTENQLAEVEKTAEDLSKSLEEAAQRIKNHQHEADEAQKAAEQARTDAEDQANQHRDQMEQERARKALRALWGRLPVLWLGKQGDNLVETLGQARAELARGHALLGAYWRRPLHVLLVSVAALVIPAVSLLLVWAKVPPVVSLFGGLAAVVPVLTSTLGAATQWGRKQLAYLEKQQADLDKAEEEARAEIYKPVRDAEAKLDDAQAALEEAWQERTATELKHRNADQRKQELREELEELTPGRIFVAFADQRSTEYGRRLGLMAHVRRDLGELQKEIIANNNALRTFPPQGAPAAAIPAGHANPMRDVPNRIVLYIDDLDRCPPEKVLEVLEAVHLLLAFEMFVVVVAVDSRWLTSALTDRLVALRSSPTATGQPTPKDYLEKIFQLPFWVQPLPPPRREHLLHGLLIDSVRELAADTGKDGETTPASGLHVGDPEEELIAAMLLRNGTEVRLDTSPLVLTLEDLAFFESLAPLLGDTPRRIKRFVNTCQLLFAIAPPLSPDSPYPSERAVVSLVAAISEGLPTVANHLLSKLEASSQRNSPHAPTETVPSQVTLPDFLASCSGIAEDERERLNTWLAGNPHWRTAQLQRLATRVDMIRRLRFEKPASLSW